MAMTELEQTEQLIIGTVIGAGLVVIIALLAALTRWLVSGWRRPGGVGRRGRRRGR
jgi:hypothetical protein